MTARTPYGNSAGQAARVDVELPPSNALPSRALAYRRVREGSRSECCKGSVLLVCAVAGALAQTEDNLAIFQSRILPVLTQNCGSCHGGSTLRVRRARRCHWAVRWSKEKTTDQPALFAKPRVITASPFSFEKHGHCEMEASELFPNLATCADDLAVVRSRAELQTPQRIKKRKAGVATSKP